MTAVVLELIDMLTKAEKPDRALDWAIHVRNGLEGVGAYGQHPAYTSSFDAALTLLRKHYLWEVKQGIGCHAIVWWIEKDWDDTGAPTGYTTTYPALALCIATLMANAVEDRALDLRATQPAS